MVSLDGTLTYRARSDGSPYAVINQARGIYTKLPETATRSAAATCSTGWTTTRCCCCAARSRPTATCAWATTGKDVRQLNRNLHVGRRRRASPRQTREGARELQRDKGLAATGALALGDAVFLPEPVRIAKVTGELGGSARPGAPVAQATSDTLEVQVDLDPSQQGEVKRGDRAQITLPGNTSVTGRVDRLGSVAQDRRDRTATPGTRPSRPTSASTTRSRRAGSTRPRSRWTSRPRAWRTP